MQHSKEIELFKKNPKLFLSRLPNEAKEEILEFLQYVIYKYEQKPSDENKKKSFIEKIEKHRYSLPSDYKFDRDSVNER